MLGIEANKPYVYTLSRPDGIVFYVGKGRNNRIHSHTCQGQKSCNPHKYSVIRKIKSNGGKVQKTILSHFDTDKEALDYEVALIFAMRAYGNLTNITDGGEGCTGRKHSEETKRRIIESNKKRSEETSHRILEANRNRSEETRRKMSEDRMGTNNPFSGRTHSEGTRHKMSEAQKARFSSEEEIHKISESHKGKHPSEETRRKISETHKGREKSVETKRKMSEANSKRVTTDETRAKLREYHKEQAKATAKGCYFHKQRRKWHSTRSVNGKTINIGYFDTEQEAREAYLKSFDSDLSAHSA